ncbi:MAG: 2OG-Fe(II) oxygenase, partial [Crocinitomicaceae bacterium]
QVLMTTVRNNERLLDMNTERAEDYWDRLREFHPPILGNSRAIGLNELFRFYKYNATQRFKRHRDGSYVRNEEEFSAYTFMIYLNDDYLGGETSFNDVVVEPKKGTALIFRHELKHEGKPIINGVKYVLRSDIMYQLTANE